MSTQFPSDFMFQLTADEADILRDQIGTSKKGRGGRRYLPYVFTEQGVAMLSSVLNSERAVLVQCRNHARLCKAAPDARVQRRTLSPAGRA